MRRDLLVRRRAMKSDEVRVKSRLIHQRLFQLMIFRSAETILWYVSYDNEVYTHEMIQACFLAKKRVVVPKCLLVECGLRLCVISSFDMLVSGAFSILEPPDSCEEVSIDMVDLIVTPGLGFDRCGHRLGLGGGYYDRLLANRSVIPVVGLAFDWQIRDTIPVSEQDISVDMIVTENEVIECS
ncbi:MAG: 5-formyltetrahydrofolate cyclo-ligase [Candidatus Thermoplasmatota archaeon]|nr:5-formyltetrahydrofolate cyclo-ligase [Candidatus Thermoplasmatota archaeon]MBU1940313.1 5-formyltetrahydrofolate cyclo-ligase [Candidatus Thermoplasmatota archaeon]